MRRAHLVVPALALALALPASAAGGSSARPTAPDRPTSVKAADPRHDVWFVDDGFAKERRRIDGSRAAGDITSLGVRQGTGAVVLRLAMRRLPKPGKHDFLITPVFLLTTPIARFTAILLSVSEEPQGFVFLVTHSGEFIECPGLRHKIGYGTGVVRLKVPRSCLANPAWARARAATLYPFAQSQERSYVDLAPGRRLGGGMTTKRAYAPAGAATRLVRPRLQPSHRPIEPRLEALMKRLGFLAR